MYILYSINISKQKKNSNKLINGIRNQRDKHNRILLIIEPHQVQLQKRIN